MTSRKLPNKGGENPTLDLSTKKISYLAADLKAWRKSKPKISDQLQAIEDALLQQQKKPPAEPNQSIQKELAFQHHTILLKQETFHWQRYKKIGASLEIETHPSSIKQFSNEPEEIA